MEPPEVRYTRSGDVTGTALGLVRGSAGPAMLAENTAIKEAQADMKRNAAVSWSGSAREGRGTFRVGSGALTAPFTYNSRFRGDSQTNPEELLLSALAGCLTMAMAAALQEDKGVSGAIETSAELDLVPHQSGGYRIPSMRLELAVASGGSQDELDRALPRAMDMCPICNALAGTDIRVTVRAVPAVSGTVPT